MKWLVIVAGASIAFAIACLEKTQAPWAYRLFAVSALLLGASTVCGVLYLFNSYYLAGLVEMGTDPTDASVVKAQARADRDFFLVKLVFPFGMLAFAIFIGIYVYDLSAKKPDPKPPEIVALAPGCRDQAILRRDEKAWILTRRKDGSLFWRPLKLPR